MTEPHGDGLPCDVAILIVAYNGRELLADCLASVFSSADAPHHDRVIIVDNASTDDTQAFLRLHYPDAHLIRSQANLGFAGGNNLGLEHIRRVLPEVRYVALLNQDTLVGKHWLTPMIRLIEEDPHIGSVQAKLLLHPQTSLLNSAGNRSHYLGFGFTGDYRQADDRHDLQPRSIAFASGAAMLIRLSALERLDLFDPAYFAYLEDAELGWRLRIRGYRNLYCPAAEVFHRYTFNSHHDLYYRLERNRYRLILSYYRLPTLLLLAPMLLIMELGLLLYFLRIGRLSQKLRSWDVWSEWRAILARRREIQRQRIISDRQLTQPFIAAADFEHVRNPILNWIGNPLLILYWHAARCLLWW